jgi:uncharacterized peroxidase-related enzyme
MISPTLATPLRALADALLVHPYEGASLTRAERELIATAVSAGNDCFYCMDTHGAFASTILQRQGVGEKVANSLVDDIKDGRMKALHPKIRELIRIALVVREHGRKLQLSDIKNAIDAGATDGDIQLSILIASAFCMYNRIVDGFRAKTPLDIRAHEERAKQIADFGYSSSRLTAIPAVTDKSPI